MAIFKGLVKSCEHCGTPFKVPQSQAHVRTCSTACGYIVRTVANKKPRLTLTCAHCGGLFTERECHADRRVYCSHQCRDVAPDIVSRRRINSSGSKNPQWKGGATLTVVSASGRVYGRQRPHLEAEKEVRRRRAKGSATPAWADRSKMRAIYAEARRVSNATGIKHHVDHIVPLVSQVVCGLHNEFNLQVLPAFDNLSKGNRLVESVAA